MYFDRNIDLSEKIRMAKKSEGNYSSYALNEEIYFRGLVNSSNNPRTSEEMDGTLPRIASFENT